MRSGIGPGYRAPRSLHLHFALGKALEIGRFPLFEQYRLAHASSAPNALPRRAHRAHTEPTQIKVCTRGSLPPDRLRDRAGPDFIIGLRARARRPRAICLALAGRGTQAANVQQLSAACAVRARADESRYSAHPGELSARTCHLERTTHRDRVYRAASRYFIDKMPNNFRHVGLIHLMLRTHASSMQGAADGLLLQHFKQLSPTAGVHLQHQRHRALLPHLPRAHASLGCGAPGRVLRVLTRSGGGPGRERTAVLAFCGLEFEPQWRRFHERPRQVRTASPRGAPGNLRERARAVEAFEPWLGELRTRRRCTGALPRRTGR